MEALKQPTLRVAAVIAEGVPEQDTKQLIAYAQKHNKIILGPATVGGMQARLPIPWTLDFKPSECPKHPALVNSAWSPHGEWHAGNARNAPRTLEP